MKRRSTISGSEDPMLSGDRGDLAADVVFLHRWLMGADLWGAEVAALDGSGFLAANPGWLDRWTDHVEQTYDLTGMARLVAAVNRRPDYTRPRAGSTSQRP